MKRAPLMDPLTAPDLDAGSAFAAAQSHFAAGRLDQAAQFCDLALAADGRHGGSLLLLPLIGAAQSAAAGHADAAIAAYEAILQYLPERADVLDRLGQTLLQAGHLDAAAARFEQAVRARPDHPTALNHLIDVRRILNQPPPETFEDAVRHHQAGNAAEAMRIYRKVIESNPAHVSAINNLGLIAPPEEAETLFRLALALRPDYFEAHLNLGAAFQAQEKFPGAIDQFTQALALTPDHVDPYFGLATVLAMTDKNRQAADNFLRVLRINPAYSLANRNLITCLESSGRLAEALIYRGNLQEQQPLTIESEPGQRRTVMVLRVAAGLGMVPYYALVPTQINTRVAWCVDYATDAQEATLPPYDVVFNAIGNAELLGPATQRLNAFSGRCTRPILNPPAQIAMTRRDLMPKLLGDLDDVVIPAVMRLRRDELEGDLVARLAAGGVRFPIIVRPISTQGGLRVLLAETPEQLAEALDIDGDALYFIAYKDYRNADGYFRKYRTIFVDRQPYHYHLAISSKWLVHYFSAEMLAEPWKRDEEQRYLENPEAALGAKAMRAVAAIGKRMDLDYGGMDYTILADGRVLVFEANATMSVYYPDSADFPYKHGYVTTILTAFEHMLDRHAKAPPRAL